MSTRTIIIVVLALVFGLSAAWGVNLVIKQSRHDSPPGTVPVVVGATRISRGAIITKLMVSVRDWPENQNPPDERLAKVEDAIGRVVYSPIAKDAPVLNGMLLPPGSAGGLSPLLRPGMLGYTVQASPGSAVAGFALPGDRVDILLTWNPNNEIPGVGPTLSLLENVEVVAVGQALEPPPEGRVDPKTLQTVTLQLSPEEAQLLDYGQNRGTIHLALRSSKENPQNDKTVQKWTLADLEKRRKAAEKGPDRVVQPVQGTGTSTKEPEYLEIRTLRNRQPGAIQMERGDYREIDKTRE